MSNDIDTLMAVVAEINAKTAGEFMAQTEAQRDRDIKILVGYHRHARSQRAAGFKTPKPKVPTMDVLKLIGHEAPPKITTVVAGPGPRRL